MGQAKPRNETLLQELIAVAKKLNIEVRTEKLLREVGYRARSGRCRVKGRELIIIDRDSPVAEQVDFLAAELDKQESGLAFLPPQLRVRPKR
ncbi:MAG: hypothetical protein A2038_08120 [Deltaproteobacteria bacterium GWA2_57_13]|nr:MAG: hypothetical protein A2038_08120 [Deltaproteobacteria bacterium GWA2_57_13]OGQ82286.1 MAG: hypothetical protein A3G40_10590 [Deltaproteobacteria bacterium RIFCSPLOWO2_12_FULL_57_22]